MNEQQLENKQQLLTDLDTLIPKCNNNQHLAILALFPSTLIWYFP